MTEQRDVAGGTPDLAAIAAALQGNRLPPVHKWDPPFCGDIDLRIGRDGTWYYGGTPIGRKPMVRLFSTVLKREDGRFFLVTPVEKLGIQVEDAPFVAVGMTRHGEGRAQALVFRTNVDDEVIAGPDHPIRVETDPATEEPSPYVLVRNDLWALIARAVFYDLAELAEPAPDGDNALLGVWSAGRFFAIGRATAV